MPSNALDLAAIDAIHARYVEGFTLDMQGYAWEVAQVLPQLVARVRELEADAKRLDWMDQCELRKLSYTIDIVADGNSARKAIDAAMAVEEG